MNLVNTETGELLDTGAAERRATRIGLRLDAIAENYRAVMPMIREAIDLRDDLALGYRSVGDYVADRFGQALSALGMELRRDVVRELTAAGLSTRAIAPVVGVDNATVHRDIRAVADATPEAPEGGANSGATSPPTSTVEPGMPRPPVTGIDGKTYTPPRPRLADDEDIQRASVRRANIAGLESVVTFLDPRTRTPRQMAESYADVLDEFDADVLDRSAATLTVIAALKKETR